MGNLLEYASIEAILVLFNQYMKSEEREESLVNKHVRDEVTHADTENFKLKLAQIFEIS